MFICLESYETKLTKVNRSKAKHAKDRNDWEWWNPCVPDRLRELDSQGYVNMGRGREEGRGGEEGDMTSWRTRDYEEGEEGRINLLFLFHRF